MSGDFFQTWILLIVGYGLVAREILDLYKDERVGSLFSWRLLENVYVKKLPVGRHLKFKFEFERT